MQQDSLLGLSARGFHNIATYVWGRADAPRTAICVHGLTRNARDFDKLAAAMAADGHYRVIAVDVVGRGQSDWLHDPTLYSYPQYLSDMNAVIARSGAKEVDWIGTSMGGLVGMMIAAQPNTPIRRLVLNDVGPLLPLAATQRIAEYVSQKPRFASMEEAESVLRNNYRLVGPETDYAAMTRHSVHQLPEGGYGLNYDPAIATAFAAIKEDVNLWPYYDAIACPTLVLRGALSDVLLPSTAREMTERGPKARLETIPEIGHYPALMDAHQIACVKDFLSAPTNTCRPTPTARPQL